MGKLRKTVLHYQNSTPAAAGQTSGDVRLPRANQPALRAAAACARQVETAAHELEAAAARLADALQTVAATRASPQVSVRVALSTGVMPMPPQPVQLLTRSIRATPDVEDAVFRLIERTAQAVNVRVVRAPEQTPALRAMRAAVEESIRLNAMYIAFIDMAEGRLGALEAALRDQPDKPCEAVSEAYPAYICNRYKQNHPRLKRCKTSTILYRSMLAVDLRSLRTGRTHVQEATKPLHTLMAYMREPDLQRVVQQTWYRLNHVMQVSMRDLLCEELIAYWCVDLQRESRRLLPVVVALQLDALDPFVAASQRRTRVHIPNLDHFVEAAAQPRVRAPRPGTLAESIAHSGAAVLQMQAQARQCAEQARAVEGSITSPAQLLQDASAADEPADAALSTTLSESESEEEDLYARRPEAPLQPLRESKAEKQPRRLRFAKRPAPASVAGPSTLPLPIEGADMAGAGLGRHKAKHRAWQPAGEASRAKAEACDRGAFPEVKLGKRAADTLRRLMAPAYPQKVKKDEYLHLLRDFAEHNGPQGTGYLKRVRQTASDTTSAPANAHALQFNGSHESIWFQRHDDQWVLHSFHYPHGRESNVELPRGMLHDYRNVFKAFEIAAPE